MKQDVPPLVVVAIAAFVWLLSACSDGGSEPTATAATTPTTAAASTASAFPTPFITPPLTPAGIDGCPIDDAVLCRLAVDLQQALNDNDATFVASRAIASQRPCRDVIYALGDDVGCDTEDSVSDPLVPLLFYGSDCCLVSEALFLPRLQEWLRTTQGRGDWRVLGIERGNTAWAGAPGIILIRGIGDDAPLITVGTASASGSEQVAGVIVGTLQTLYIFPDAELVPWP